MKNLTADQHFKWFVDGQEFADRVSDTQKFTVVSGNASRPLKSWKEELVLGLEKMVEDHGSKIALFYSGGSDSEVILRVLVEMGVKPEVFTIHFNSGSNVHETKHASELCKILGVKQNIFNHDIDRYLREELYLESALKYQCSQLAYLTVLEHVMKVDLPAVMGGEIYVQKHQRKSDTVSSPTEWYYVYREDEDGMTYRYTRDTGHALINEVMSYTPELMLAWLKHPVIQDVANNRVPGKITLLSVKRKAYEEQLGHPLMAQTKFHGYEALTWTNLKVTSELKQHWPTQQEVRLEYHNLIESMQYER